MVRTFGVGFGGLGFRGSGCLGFRALLGVVRL